MSSRRRSGVRRDASPGEQDGEDKPVTARSNDDILEMALEKQREYYEGRLRTLEQEMERTGRRQGKSTDEKQAAEALRAADHDITALRRETNSLRTDVESKDAMIATLQRKLEDRERKLEERGTSRSEKAGEGDAGMSRRLREMEELNKRREAENAAQRRHVTALQSDLERAQKTIADLLKQFQHEKSQRRQSGAGGHAPHGPLEEEVERAQRELSHLKVDFNRLAVENERLREGRSPDRGPESSGTVVQLEDSVRLLLTENAALRSKLGIASGVSARSRASYDGPTIRPSSAMSNAITVRASHNHSPVPPRSTRSSYMVDEDPDVVKEAREAYAVWAAKRGRPS